jgi:hypothetical protein
MTIFTVRRGFDAAAWYRSAVDHPAKRAVACAEHADRFEWEPDGVTEYGNVNTVEIVDRSGEIVLTRNAFDGWRSLPHFDPVTDAVTYLRSLDAPEPADDNITDGGELLRMKALRQAVIDEITWHNNEAAHHRDAAAECTDEDYTDEHWGHTLDAHSHDKAAERLRAILNGAVPPAPEAAS